MNPSIVNQQIRKVSNTTALPVLIFALGQLVFGTIAGVIFTVMERSGIALSDEMKSLILYSAVYIVGGGIAVLVFYLVRSKETGLRLGQVFQKPKQSVGWIIKWFVIIWGMTYLTNFFTSMFTAIMKLLHIELQAPQIGFNTDPFGIFVSVFSIAILAPVFEELIFRSAVYRNAEVMGQGFAIVASALLFGLMHQNYAQLFYTFVMGMGMAFLVAKTRSVIPAMLFHFLLNGYAVLTGTLLKDVVNIDASNPSQLRDLLVINPGLIATILIPALFNIGMIVAGIVLLIVTLVKCRGRLGLIGSVFPVGPGRYGQKNRGILYRAGDDHHDRFTFRQHDHQRDRYSEIKQQGRTRVPVFFYSAGSSAGSSVCWVGGSVVCSCALVSSLVGAASVGFAVT